MATSRKLLFLLVAAFVATVVVPAPVQAQQEYCGDSLAGLMECESFMFGGAAAPSPACCAAYEAAFDADPFCLCYVADGTFGRATGYNVDVTHALRIPAGCSQAEPPIELCSMQGLVLPPYAPAQPSATGAPCPTAQPPSGSSGAPPSFASPPPPPPPAPTSDANNEEALFRLFVGVAILWWSATI